MAIELLLPSPLLLLLVVVLAMSFVSRAVGEEAPEDEQKEGDVNGRPRCTVANARVVARVKSRVVTREKNSVVCVLHVPRATVVVKKEEAHRGR